MHQELLDAGTDTRQEPALDAVATAFIYSPSGDLVGNRDLGCRFQNQGIIAKNDCVCGELESVGIMCNARIAIRNSFS